MKKNIIHLDSREDVSIFNAMLRANEKMGFSIEMKMLKTGDVVYRDLVFERKEINDLCGSITDGRLDKQLERMQKEFKEKYLIVHGQISKRYSDIHEHALLGYIASVWDKYKIPTFILENEDQAAYLILTLCRRKRDKRKKKQEENGS